MKPSNTQCRRVGYIRVNTLCNDLQEQLKGLTLDRVFQDTIIRKKQFLLGFATMMNSVSDGDTLFVQRLDRLARNPNDLLDNIYELTRRGVRIECIDERIIFPAGAASPIRNLMLLIMGAFWETSQAWIRERHREGRAWDNFESWEI